MNILDYLKWRAEHKQQVEAEKRAVEAEEREVEADQSYDKLQIEIGELGGEIEGLKGKASVYERASLRLMFSNHQERGDIAVELGKKVGRLVALKQKRDKLAQIRPNNKVSFFD